VRYAGKRQLRETDYWIAVSEKVGTERLIYEGMPDNQSGDFEVNPGTDWEPVKPVREVLNRRST